MKRRVYVVEFLTAASNYTQGRRVICKSRASAEKFAATYPENTRVFVGEYKNDRLFEIIASSQDATITKSER